jgi:aminopeptidase-like protein
VSSADEISELLEILYPFDYSIAGVDNDQASKVLCNILPFQTTEYPSGSEVNGWVIPQGWKLNSLKIYKDDSILLEFYEHSFCVPKNTPSVDIKNLTYSQLISRINRSVSGNFDDFVYDWRNLYRNRPTEWSICLTESMIENISDGSFYRVVIDSTFYNSTMKVLEFNTHNTAKNSIVINAHNCHPFQANDDVSGMIASILLAKRWMLEQNVEINLKVIIAPELYGPIFYLNSMKEASNHLGAILFKAVGNRGILKLQDSIQRNSEISLIARDIIRDLSGAEHIYDFRSLYGNDEIVFENPPFCIPTITLTRIPFLQYHNSSDTPAEISIDSIEETIDSAFNIVKALQGNYRYRWLVHGLPKLSDLPYEIYKPVRAHGIHDEGSSEIEKRWHILMNSLPAIVGNGLSTLEISQRFQLPIFEIIEYLHEWEKAGFIERIEKSQIK